MRQFTCPKAVTHPSTNRARCRATALIETNALPLHQTANSGGGLTALPHLLAGFKVPLGGAKGREGAEEGREEEGGKEKRKRNERGRKGRENGKEGEGGTTRFLLTPLG